MITVLAVHFAVAAVAPFLFRKFGRNSFFALAAVPAGSFVWLILQHGAVRQRCSGRECPHEAKRLSPRIRIVGSGARRTLG